MVFIHLDIEEDDADQDSAPASGSTTAPYKQGQLDGLCGLYSAVNAFALLAARGKPVRRSACKRLFRKGLAIIASHMSLEAALDDGVQSDVWLDVVCRLAKAASDEFGLAFEVSRPLKGQSRIGHKRLRQEIEQILDSLAVLLISLEGVHQHYTLLSSHTATRYILHDSGGLRWLHKANCGAEGTNRRHEIAASWLLAVRVVPAHQD